MSLIAAVQYSNEEIAEKIENQKETVSEHIKAYTQNEINGFSHEEEERIRRGEVTAEQAFESMIGSTKTEINDTSAIVGKSIEQLYLTKASYIGKLGELERRAVSDYKSLEKEKRGLKAQKTIISHYIKEAASLEKECDGIVDELLSSLKQQLISVGADTQIIKTIKKAYEDEKILKKSYYLNLYR